MDLIPLLHDIAQIQFAGPDGEVRAGATVPYSDNHDGNEDAPAIFRSLGLLELVESLSHGQFIHYEFRLERPTLSEHWAAFPPPTVLLEGLEREIVGCFLRVASQVPHNLRFTSPLGFLPIARDPAPIPPRFARAVTELAGGGYCELADGAIHWTAKAVALFHRQAIWIDGMPAIDAEIAKLTEIWLTMPEGIRRHCVFSDGLNELLLAEAMQYYWAEGVGWHDYQVQDPPAAWQAQRLARDLATMLEAHGTAGGIVQNFQQLGDLIALQWGRRVGAVLSIALIMLSLGATAWAVLYTPDPAFYGPTLTAMLRRKYLAAAVVCALATAAMIWTLGPGIVDDFRRKPPR